MRALRVLALAASFVLGCDAVPDLYVVDASIASGTDSGGVDAGSDAAGDDASDASGTCTGVSCPACPPNPGTCCQTTGIPCAGDNCAVNCESAACTGCAPTEECCSKQGGQPVCRNLDGGKCPP